MTNVHSETTSSGTNMFRRVSWAAIFAGVIFTVVIQLLLTLLGVGIGAATVEPLQQAQPGKGVGIGASIWLFVSTLIAVYTGARVAAHLSGTTPKSDGVLHGILTWGTTAIASVVFLTTAGGVLFGGAASFLGGATAMTARNQPASANYEQSATTTSGRVSEQANLSPTGRDSQDQSAIQSEQGRQTEQRAREAGDVAARRVSQAALWSFFLLLLSGLVAAWAGGSGVPLSWRHDSDYGHMRTEPAR